MDAGGDDWRSPACQRGPFLSPLSRDRRLRPPLSALTAGRMGVDLWVSRLSRPLLAASLVEFVCSRAFPFIWATALPLLSPVPRWSARYFSSSCYSAIPFARS